MIRRNEFLAGTNPVKLREFKPIKRSRPHKGLKRLVRNEFMTPEGISRGDIPIDVLKGDTFDEGMKIRLDSKTLQQFRVQVKDDNDVAWLREKQRLLDAGKTEAEIAADPPLGRQQYKKFVMANFSTKFKSSDDKIEQLQAAMNQGLHRPNLVKRMLLNALLKYWKANLPELKHHRCMNYCNK